MSLDTVTTCRTAQRSGQSKRKSKRSSMKKDLTLPNEPTFCKTEMHIDDDLNLELLEVPDIPEDMLFPGEFNVYLQDKLKSVCEENKQLNELIKKQEEEISSVKEKLEKYEGLHQASNGSGIDSFRHSDLAACRIMELIKQICELTSQLEEQRSRCTLAETKLLSFLGCQKEEQPINTEILLQREAEIKRLSEKLHTSNSKLFDCRNKIQHLQQELKNAHKVLVCEVGNSELVSELISSSGQSRNWRGRAQQIHVLQQRVIELSDRLRKECDNRITESSTSNCQVEKHSCKERKALLEAAQQETRNVQQQLCESTRKLDAAKARIKVLESDVTSLKARVQLLTEKSSRDDEFIYILQSQINQLEGHLQNCKEEAKAELKKAEKYHQELLDDQKMEKQRGLQLLSNLEEKEKQIKHLQCMLFAQTKMETDLSTSDERCKDVIAALTDNPVTECSCACAVSHAKESHSNMECKKLLDLVGTLNRRLNDARHECDQQKSALRHERRTVARLEAKLTRLEMERNGTLSLCRKRSLLKARNSYPVELQDKETPNKELIDKLELLQEEILTLKTRLSCLEQEKEDDLEAFISIISGSPCKGSTKFIEDKKLCVPPEQIKV